MADDPNHGSEYGGAPGVIQPSPHDPADSANEIRLLMMRTNPAGETSGQRRMTPDETDPFVPTTRRVQ